MFKDKDERGFTLVEVLLSIFVATILGVAIAAFSRGIFRNSSLLRANISDQVSIRKTFKSFTEEVRGATSAFDGSYTIETASSTTFTFFSNIDQDIYPEKISYFVSGNNLNKSITKFSTSSGHYTLSPVSRILVKNIKVKGTAPIFSYFDTNYDGTEAYSSLAFPVDISKIRLVKFDLTGGESDKYIKTSKTNIIQVSIRNLKDNY